MTQRRSCRLLGSRIRTPESHDNKRSLNLRQKQKRENRTLHKYSTWDNVHGHITPPRILLPLFLYPDLSNVTVRCGAVGRGELRSGAIRGVQYPACRSECNGSGDHRICAVGGHPKLNIFVGNLDFSFKQEDMGRSFESVAGNERLSREDVTENEDKRQ